MKQNELILILISTTVIVFAWIIFSVYHSFITSTITETVNTNIFPISPNFDMQTIENLKRREKVAPAYQIQNVNLTPTPSITPQVNTATSSGQSTAVTNELPVISP